MAARCGNTGVVVGSEWCGLCRVHGCEGYKSYKQKGMMKSRKICEIRVLRGNDEKTVLKPFENNGFEIYEIGETGNTRIYEIRVESEK